MCPHTELRVDIDGAIVCELCGGRLGAPSTMRQEPWGWGDASHEDEEAY